METIMDSVDIFNFAQVGSSIVVAICMFLALLSFLKNVTSLNNLINASSLSKNSEVGAYVKFKGGFTGDALKTPVSNQSCSYWSLVIRAEFQTKKKKPDKGMQTHNPVLYKASSDELPLLISDGSQIIQLMLDNSLAIMSNPSYTKNETITIPVSEIQDLVKPKYKKYISEEFWFPVDSDVTIWGYILGRNKNSVLLSNGEDKIHPPLMILGDESQLHQEFSRANRFCLYLLIWSVFQLYSLWTWLPDIDHILISILLCGSFFVVSYVIYRDTKVILRSK